MRQLILTMFLGMVVWQAVAQPTTTTGALPPEKQGGDINKIFDIRQDNTNIRYDFIKFNPKYQPAPLSRKCIAVELDKQQKALNAGERVMDFEQWLQGTMTSDRNIGKRSVDVYTIPVVVHIIYSSEEENIPREQVISQIESLNKDYQRLNKDTTLTPNHFKPVAANVGLQFKLATRDPEGKPTDGIERISVNGSPFREKYFNEVIKPNTIWEPHKYLNIWVANLANGVLGFAQFPESSGLVGIPNEIGTDLTDGVVINYLAFGTIGNLMEPFNHGRTVTHEVGHWLGLRHIWGDGGCGVDDFCEDTPDTDAPHFGCNTKVKACDGNEAMIQNFMDYTNDECMNMFTLKQRERVRTVMENSPRRKELHDAGTAKPLELMPKADFLADLTMGAEGLSVQFKDVSQGSIGSRVWKFEGGVPATSTNATPKVLYNKAGSYPVSLIVKNSKGIDSLLQQQYIKVWDKGLTIPAKWDFETETSISDLVISPKKSWKPAQNAGGFGLSAKSLFADNYRNKKIGERNVMLLPPINFTTGYKNILSFDLAYSGYNEFYMDSLGIYLSTDNGKTFRCIYFKYGSDLVTFVADSTKLEPTVQHWRTELIDLQKYDNQTSVMLAFVNVNGYGNNLFIDNIEVSSLPLPTPLADFQVNKKEICVGEKIKFTDKSKYQPEKWVWSFPNADIVADSTQNPTISYSTPGTYDISLTVSNKNGGNTKTEKALLVVKPSPEIKVSEVPKSLCKGETLTLKAESDGLIIWKVLQVESSKIRKVVPRNILLDTLKSNTHYHLESKGENGCTTFKEFTTSVKDNPIIEVTPAVANICQGDSVVLTAKNATNFEWSPAIGLNQNTGSVVVARPENSVTYTLKVRAENGCTQTKDVWVNVQPLPKVTVTSPKNVACVGEQLRLTADGAANYFWRSNGSNIRGNGKYLTVSLSKPTLYKVVGVNEAGCADSASIEMAVENPPMLSYSPEKPTVCQGGALTLTASGANTYTWQVGDNEVLDATLSIEPQKEMVYTLIGESENGCVAKTKVPIKVWAQKTLNVESDANIVCPNRMVVITALGAKSYQWEGSDGYTSKSSSISVAPRQKTTYKVVGIDENGCETEESAIELGIGNNQSPIADFIIEDLDVCTKTPVVIKDNSENVKKYLWTFQSDKDIFTSTRPSPEMMFDKIGVYHVKLKVEGCTGIAESKKDIILNVQESPDVIVVADKTQICEGEKVLLSAAARGNNQLVWSPTTGLSQKEGKSVTAVPSQTTDYTVTAINANGCQTKNSVKIQVNQSTEKLKFNIVSPTICQGEGILLETLNGKDPEWKYETERYVKKEVRLSPKKTTTYKVMALDSMGCVMKSDITIKVNTRPNVTIAQPDVKLCKGGQAKLTANGAASYHWFPDKGLNAITGQTVTAFPQKTDRYTAVGTDENGCRDSANVVVTVMETPSIAITASSTKICQGQTAILTATTTNSLTWADADGKNLGGNSLLEVAPEQTNQYFVVAKGEGHCVSSANVIIEVVDADPINIVPANATVCVGDTITLKAQGNYKFNWDEKVGDFQQNKSRVIVRPTETNIYTVKALDEKGCTHTGVATVSVRKAEAARITASAFETCEGQDVTLKAEGGKTYQWLPAQNFQPTQSQRITVSPKRGMENYKVVVKDEYGCKDTAAVNIAMRVMKPEFTASATEIDLATQKGLVRFSDKTPDAVSWKWEFGDGSKGEGNDVKHIFTQAGSYQVNLEISNGNCTQTLSKTIRVKNSSSIKNVANWDVKPLPNQQFEIMMNVPQAMSFILKIINTKKENVLEGSIFPKKGAFVQTIDLSSFEKGKYSLEISDGNETITKEIEVK